MPSTRSSTGRKPIAAHVVAACIGLAMIAAGCEQPVTRAEAPAHSVRLRLATFNVQNLFDIFDDAYTPDEKSWPKHKTSIRRVGETLIALDADFVGVQEVENVGILTRVRDWNLVGRGYDYIWCNYRLEGRGINLGYLSRVPVGSVSVYPQQRLRLPESDGQWTFARGLASVELQPAADVRVQVFVVHFKSKLTVEETDPQSAAWRLSEALGLRRLIAQRLQREPGAYVAVMGDLNDTPLSPPLRTLLKVGPDGQALLVDPHEGLAPEQRITYLKKPYRANVDYILLSPALAQHVAPGSAQVYGHEPNGSDHAPVMVTLQLPTRHADAASRWPSPHPVEPVTVKMRPRADKTPAETPKPSAAP